MHHGTRSADGQPRVSVYARDGNRVKNIGKKSSVEINKNRTMTANLQHALYAVGDKC